MRNGQPTAEMGGAPKIALGAPLRHFFFERTGACARALAAAVFSAGVDLGSLKTRAAADAALRPVSLEFLGTIFTSFRSSLETAARIVM